MEYTIKPERGYFTVYVNGNFYCTADTWSEAEREVETYLRKHNFRIATAQN